MSKELLGSLELNRIYQMDCLEGMKLIPDNSIDLVVTSPPYNIGKEYEKKIDIERYLQWSKDYLEQVYRVLKTGRSFMLEIGCYIDNNTNNIPLAYLLYPIIHDVGFKLRQEIVWHFKGGMQAKKKLTGQNEKILWLYKGNDSPYFDLDSIRVKEWQAIDKRNNPNGKNPTDVWEVNRVTGNSHEKVGHPCQFPIALIERIVKGWSVEEESVLDPFMGSGTLAVVSKMLNRKYIGFEMERKYIEMSNQRLESTYRVNDDYKLMKNYN